jgi:hypothetical protein
MSKHILLNLAILALILSACGAAGESTPVPEIIATQPMEVAPTIAPTPTEVPEARPKPGATYAGLIQMGDKATMATINLTISPEGDKISVGVSFSV